jgi:Tol biopolymer transport system component
MPQRSPASVLGTALALSLTLALTGTAAAAVASNGKIAYQCENEQSYFDICVVDPETGAVENLTNDSASDGFPSWSPDGTQIAFGSDHSIDVINADGSGRRHVIGGYGESAFSPAWSPDGSRIAFVSTRGETDYEIWTVPAAGATETAPAVRLTTTPRDRWGKGQDDFSPAWSPDSRRIVFVGQNRDLSAVDACDVFAMDSVDTDQDGNGDNLLRLTHDNVRMCSAWEDVNPSWSPTGDLIAYSSGRTGNADIWVMNPDGSGQRNLTDHPSWDWMPGWSPDGTQVTFTSGRDGDEDIYALSLEDASAPVAVAARTSTRRRRPRAVARAAAEPGLVQLTHNDTQDRLSDWGAAPAVPVAPTTEILQPKHGADLRRTAFSTIEGRASGERDIIAVHVALRQRLADGTCRWWTGSRFTAQGCGTRLWVKAAGTKSWSFRLKHRLGVSGRRIRSYTAYARATDDARMRTSKFEAGQNANTFKLE